MAFFDELGKKAQTVAEVAAEKAKAAAAVISMTLYLLSFTLYPFLSSRVQDQAFFNSPVPFSISASLSFAYPSMTVDG